MKNMNNNNNNNGAPNPTDTRRIPRTQSPKNISRARPWIGLDSPGPGPPATKPGRGPDGDSVNPVAVLSCQSARSSEFSLRAKSRNPRAARSRS
ncbi:hypothetical protein MPTK1_7g14790 [Marchantia polymorpha subsp. ruderalis]|uniref:Uncharacterized protein n=2 Tax=Marchantia polymorpha TaxID=3197 RepID=A0AAF6BZN6_MARPO|nr:hypothetical protein MARPO_0009s0164 [Marchantia polymorpha]BBN17470.1 hypothetical protein Mp_7g14790 [Marchantia polymorpha subsp. ruderalis]|eukprot:PTQ47075.1 hypothetical protein MARPO_0009s0164 [Marchantia polymorpha]